MSCMSYCDCVLPSEQVLGYKLINDKSYVQYRVTNHNLDLEDKYGCRKDKRGLSGGR